DLTPSSRAAYSFPARRGDRPPPAPGLAPLARGGRHPQEAPMMASYRDEAPAACGVWPTTPDGTRAPRALPCVRPAEHGGVHESAVGGSWTAPREACPDSSGADYEVCGRCGTRYQRGRPTPC